MGELLCIVTLNAPYAPPGSESDLVSTANGGGGEGGGGGGSTGGAHVHTSYQSLAERGEPDGYASLSEDGQVPDDQVADGTAASGDVPISNGDGTRTWGPQGGIDYGEDADITDQDYNDVADAGVLDEVARADHLHGMPASGGGGPSGPN